MTIKKYYINELTVSKSVFDFFIRDYSKAEAWAEISKNEHLLKKSLEEKEEFVKIIYEESKKELEEYKNAVINGVQFAIGD